MPTFDPDVAELRAQLDRIEARSVRKCSRSRRQALQERSHSEFCAAFLECGMGQSELAARLGVSRQYVHDMLKGSRLVPDWVLRGMPTPGRRAIARGYVTGLESEPLSEAG